MSAHIKPKHNNGQSFTTVGSYRYKQSDLLGSGYESQVYKATHITKKFEVAIKIIDLQKIAQGIHTRLLESELRCLQALKRTPYIINLLDIVKTEKQIYVVTQICQGDLGSRKQKRVPENKAWQYMKQLIKGYKYLYDKGIIHRDLKPQNMFIKSGGQVKIGDFGFATTFKEAKQQSHYNIGSPSYMAPEVLSRNDYSHASDVWSIGVSYYELLTGNVPWQGECEAQIRSQITRDSIEDVIHSSTISQASKEFLKKTLQFSPHDRINPQELFDYQINFNIPRRMHHTQKCSDKYSVTTAETPKYTKNKQNGFMTPKNNSTKFDFDQLTDDIFNQSVQVTQSSRELKTQNERHSRRMSFDGNFLASKQQLQVPSSSKQLTMSSQNSVGDRMNFKKKHRTSFDVGSSKQMSNHFTDSGQTSLGRIVDGYIKLCGSIFQFLKQTSKAQQDKLWGIQFNIFRICMKNYLIKTLNKIENLQSSDLLREIASEQQIKKFCDEQQFKNAYNLVQKNKQIYMLNQEILKHLRIVRQQKLKNLLNSGYSLLSALKKSMTNQSSEDILVISELVCVNVQICLQLQKKSYLTPEDISNVKRIRKAALSTEAILKRISSLER